MTGSESDRLAAAQTLVDGNGFRGRRRVELPSQKPDQGAIVAQRLTAFALPAKPAHQSPVGGLKEPSFGIARQ